MNRLLNQLGVSDQFKISAILKVEELADHDMIYVYHHLEEGKLIELRFSDHNVKGESRFKVFYQEFFLGVVTLSGIIGSFYHDEKLITAEIAGLSKEKYFPLKALDIRLGINAYKKVG
ncbi:MAG: hypothetical protein R2780_08245 [Crocinitomicaceae bacterium]